MENRIKNAFNKLLIYIKQTIIEAVNMGISDWYISLSLLSLIITHLS